MTKTRITFQDFFEFVKHQGNLRNNAYAEDLAKQKTPPTKIMNLHVPQQALRCPQCDEFHKLWQCEIFKRLNIDDKNETVKQAKLCRNCLRPNHFSRDCKSKFKCKTCDKPHNSLLHFDYKSSLQSFSSSGASQTKTTDKPQGVISLLQQKVQPIHGSKLFLS